VSPTDLNKKYIENKKLLYNTDMDTDKINSDDMDFYNRKRNFELITKKLNKYYDQKYNLFRGNDLRYNNYVRKIQKLSKHESLDYEGYKDFYENYRKLNESKSEKLKNIAKHFLNEFLTKESIASDIKEFVRKTENLINQNNQNNTDGSNKIIINSTFENLINTKNLNKDMNEFLEINTRNFLRSMKNTFKIKEDDNLNNKEVEDLKVLRLAKLVIKLRHLLLAKEAERKEKIDGETKIDDVKYNYKHK
jgi:hypothetical protein